MIRLDLKRGPHWLDVGHGVRLHVRPCTTALMMAARAEAQKAEDVDHPARTAALVTTLARLAIIDREGPGPRPPSRPSTGEFVLLADARLILWDGSPPFRADTLQLQSNGGPL
jgi:hypothetical protein